MKSFELPILVLVTLCLSARIENVNAAEGESADKGDQEEKSASNESPERFDSIDKPSLDTRTYRGLILPKNHLKVLLVHDSTAAKKFVSLSVGVGSFNDPKDLPGLTNLLGSMMVLGSEEYPTDITDETKIPRVVTNAETQTFSFESDKSGDFYHYQIEAFTSCMIDPLLDDADESALKSRIAQLSESAQMLRQSDNEPWAIHQIERMLFDERHPNSYFSQANQDIMRGYPGPIYEEQRLDDEAKELIAKRLWNLFNKWYSLSIMTLVVTGNDPLDEIEQEIRTIFEEVGEKEALKPWYTDAGDDAQSLIRRQRKIYIVPQNNIDCLRLFFSTPNVREQYKKAPVRYVSYLINHEGPGSLNSVLRKRKLCEDLKTAYEEGGNLGLFHITCFLTEKGLKSINTVVELIFQYINMVRDVGVQKSIFEELEKIDRAEFVYKESTQSSLAFVEELSNALLRYPFEDVLSYNYLHDQWDEELIRNFLAKLTPDNMNMSIVSKLFKEEATETETFFGTNFKIVKIDEQDILNWSKTQYSDEFRPPSKNNFIPEDFTLYPISKDEPSDPRLIQDSHVSQIWFKPDTSFKTPKLHVYLLFFSPMTRLDPSYRCLLEIFMKILRSSLNEELHSARVAGIDWNLTSNHYGIIADVYGYNDKLPLVLEKIIKKFTDYENELDLNEQLFLDMKKEFEGDLTVRGVKTKSATDHGWNYLTFLLNESGWTDEDLLIILEPLLYEELIDFLPDLMANLYIQGLIHGNCSPEKAEEIIAILEKPFEPIYGLLPQQLLPERTVKLNERSHSAFLALNTNSETYAHYSYYQLDSKTIRDTVTSHLMVHVLGGRNQILEEVKVQSCGGLTLSGVEGVFFMSTSKNEDSHKLDKMTEEFIKKIPEALNEMSDEEFEDAKKLLIAKKSDRPQYLKSITEEYWFEIMNRTHHFDRRNDEIKEVNNLTKSDLLSFHKKYLDPKSNARGKLAVHIIPESDQPSPLTVPSGVSKVENITIFKSSLKLLPLPTSKISSSTPGNKSKLRKPISTFEDSEEEKEEEEASSSKAEEASTSKERGAASKTQASTSGEKGKRSASG